MYTKGQKATYKRFIGGLWENLKGIIGNTDSCPGIRGNYGSENPSARYSDFLDFFHYFSKGPDKVQKLLKHMRRYNILFKKLAYGYQLIP